MIVAASTASHISRAVTQLAADLSDVDLSLIGKDLVAADAMANTDQALEEIAKSCATKSILQIGWSLLAGRVLMHSIKRNVAPTFSQSTQSLKKHLNVEYYNYVMEHAAELDAMVVPERDYTADYFAVATAKQSYLSRVFDDKERPIILETLQYMYMRVATYCWYPNTDRIRENYNDMSLGLYTPASPTLFNAGKMRPQLASCFLLTMGDNMQSITKTWHDTAIISMNRGGIGLDMSQIRHSEIEGSGGKSKGIMPWIKIQNEIIKSVDQGGMRKGSATLNLRVAHVDVYEFVEARRGDGAEHMRARDLFYCLVIDDLFMNRVYENGVWSLFCPNKAKGLFEKWGLEYENLYLQYESKKMYVRQVRAQDLWKKITDTIIETGMPFVLFIDAVNRKSNQRNLGLIRQANLCVSGDTIILTRNGECQIITLKDKLTEVWNGKKWSQVIVRQTGSHKNLLRIGLSSGRYIDCTAEHSFFIMDKAQPCKMQACELLPGMKLEPFVLPNVGEVRLTVTSVNKGPQDVDTYCFTEPECNKGVFNGALIGNCMEITEYTSPDEIASCNLSSIALNKCVVVKGDGTSYFDFMALTKITRNLVRNLNQVIDRNYYPDDVPQIRFANFKNRPIGIGVQGLADTFALLDISWVVRDAKTNKLVTNPIAAKLNHDIFETMYYASVRESVEMAKESGHYGSFVGCPASKGLFQPDLWDIEKMEKEARRSSTDFSAGIATIANRRGYPDSRYSTEEWENLRSDMVKYGRRNSLLIALMPTASSASLLGNNESFEPFTRNIYARDVLSGQHILVNKHMVRDLKAIGMWTTDVLKNIIINKGSIQEIEVPSTRLSEASLVARVEALKLKYLTAFEIPQRTTLELMLARGRFVCQSQSFNCFMKDPTYEKLTSFLFAAWEGGATTGMYYLHQPNNKMPLNVSLDGLVIATPANEAPKNVPSQQLKQYKCDDLSCCT